MNQPRKLETVTPPRRSDSGTTAAPASQKKPPAKRTADTASPPADAELLQFRVRSDRAQPIRSISISAQAIPRLQTDPTSNLDPQPFTKKKLLTLLPGWSISLVGHVALLVILAIVVANPNVGPGSIGLDGQLVDASEAVDDELPANELLEDSNVLEVDLAALNSEASFDTADVLHDQGVDVSLMEGFEHGDGLEGLASSGLTPIESSDNGGISGDKGNAASFFGSKAEGSRFVFIIDYSDSMNEGFRWERALMELEKAIGGLTEKEQAVVLLYNFQTFPMFGALPENVKLLPVSDVFKKSLHEWLATQRPFGGTRPAHALQYSLSLRPDAIFLLSDGLLADNSLEVVAELNRFPVRDSDVEMKIPIHTISLGPNVKGAEIMKFIADTNEGSFNWVR